MLLMKVYNLLIVNQLLVIDFCLVKTDAVTGFLVTETESCLVRTTALVSLVDASTRFALLDVTTLGICVKE